MLTNALLFFLLLLFTLLTATLENLFSQDELTQMGIRLENSQD